MTFSPAVIEPIQGTVTCTLDRSDPEYLRVDRMLGTFDVSGRRIRFRSDSGSALIVMVDPTSGQPLGEYSGQITSIADQADRSPLLLEVPEFAFEPIDVAYAPLGTGAEVPRTVSLRVDYSCDLSGLPPA
jgi:hypothetical protein